MQKSSIYIKSLFQKELIKVLHRTHFKTAGGDNWPEMEWEKENKQQNERFASCENELFSKAVKIETICNDYKNYSFKYSVTKSLC